MSLGVKEVLNRSFICHIIMLNEQRSFVLNQHLTIRYKKEVGSIGELALSANEGPKCKQFLCKMAPVQYKFRVALNEILVSKETGVLHW